MRALPCLSAAAFAACARSGDPVARGQGLFIASGCSICHAVGPGGPTTGPDLSFTGFTHSPEWLERWLKDPRAWKPDTAMPQTQLSDSARKDLVAYLASLKGQSYAADKPWAAPALAADPAKRGELIFNAVGCVGCHGPEGRFAFPNNNVPGGKVPALDQVKEGFSREELVKKLRLGVPHPQKQDPAGPEPLLSMPAWGQALKDDELDALAAYLFSLSKPSKSDW